MNQALIDKLETLNDQFPYRIYELETMDGCRIRITRRFTKLWGDEKTNGDIKIENGLIAYLRYSELKDVIYFVPPWKRPFSWLYNNPQYALIPLMCLFWGIMIGIGLETCALSSMQRVEHKQ